MRRRNRAICRELIVMRAAMFESCDIQVGGPERWWQPHANRWIKAKIARSRRRNVLLPALVSLGQPKGTAHEVQYFAGGRSYPLNEPRSCTRQSERPRFSHGRSCGEFGQPRDGAEDGNDDRQWRPIKSERKWYIDIRRERRQWRCGPRQDAGFRSQRQATSGSAQA